MDTVRAYVWKDRIPGNSKPWNVAFLDPERPGEEIYEGKTFKRWAAAMKRVDVVMRERREEQG